MRSEPRRPAVIEGLLRMTRDLADGARSEGRSGYNRVTRPLSCLSDALSLCACGSAAVRIRRIAALAPDATFRGAVVAASGAAATAALYRQSAGAAVERSRR